MPAGYMMGMTTINPEAKARQDAARVHGRFGVQQHSAPEQALQAVHEVDSAYGEVIRSSREAQAAKVAVAAARMPEHIKGVRFIRSDGDVIPALFIPTIPGGHVGGVGEYSRDYLSPVPAYIRMGLDVVELEEVLEGNGHPAWEWHPTAEQRALTPEDADAALNSAHERFVGAKKHYEACAAEYLRGQMPAVADRLIVAYGPVRVDGRYISVPQIADVFDANGERVTFNIHAKENADYVRTVSNFGFSALDHFPHGTNAVGGIEYTINRKI